MIAITVNDRLGRKARILCNEDDTIGDLKKVVAVKFCTNAERIVLKKWYSILKDHIKLEDYEASRWPVLADLIAKDLGNMIMVSITPTPTCARQYVRQQLNRPMTPTNMWRWPPSPPMMEEAQEDEDVKEEEDRDKKAVLAR